MLQLGDTRTSPITKKDTYGDVIDMTAEINQRVGSGRAEFTPVEIATMADPSLRTGTTSSRSMNQEPQNL
jgi:hypothetical protein